MRAQRFDVADVTIDRVPVRVAEALGRPVPTGSSVTTVAFASSMGIRRMVHSQPGPPGCAMMTGPEPAT